MNNSSTNKSITLASPCLFIRNGLIFKQKHDFLNSEKIIFYLFVFVSTVYIWILRQTFCFKDASQHKTQFDTIIFQFRRNC